MLMARTGFGLMLLLLASCSQHAQQQPTELPYGLMQPEANSENTAFASTLLSHTNDSLPLPLNRYLQRVINANPNLMALQTHLNAADMAQQKTPSRWMPEGSINVNANRSGNITTSNNPEQANNRFSIGGDIRWAVDIWGRVRHQTLAQSLSVDAQSATFAWSQRLLIAQAISAWVEFNLRTQQLEQQQALLSMQDVLKTSIDKQYRQGQITYEQRLEQHQLIQEYERRLHQIDYDHRLAMATLNTLQGQAPLTPIAADIRAANDATAWSAQNLPPLPSPMSIERLSQRPDIQAQFIRIQQADQQAFAAHKALLPQLTLSASISQSSDSLNSIFEKDLLWQLVGGITQPLLLGSELRANAARASKTAEAALYEYQDTVLKALLEVQTKLVEEKQQLEQINSVQLESQYKQHSLSKQHQGYQSGQTKINSLLKANMDAVLAKHALQNQQLVYIKHRVSIALALGEPLEQLVIQP